MSTPIDSATAITLPLEEAKWFEGKEFTTDWMTNKISRWKKTLKEFVDKEARVLEVGSYEGRSAIFMLNYMPAAHLTCIDLFPPTLDQRFDRNTADFRDRVRKIKGSAILALETLSQDKEKFDLIYLDAGKRRDHVLTMSLIAWRLLAVNGMLIWDDYNWGPQLPSSQRPHDAIDIFLSLHKTEISVLWKTSQVAIRRRSA